MPAANTASSFISRVAIPMRIEDECWEWTGQRLAFGYGRLGWQGRKVLAHRVSHELFVGPVPEGMVVMHRCDNPPCVRPSHLRLGSRADNNADAAAKGRSANRLTHAARPTHCPAGHDYASSGVRRHGKIVCRLCDAARTRRYYRTHRDKITAALKAKRQALHGGTK